MPKTNLNYLSDPKYTSEQYKHASNLNQRISLHQRFSANKYGWHPWVFDQLDLPAECDILELGCGPADLWRENIIRIPDGWRITLTDFSAGMIEQAQSNLVGDRRFQFQIVDVGSPPLPFGCGHFDAVIANHMLYHVADRPAVFAEIRRVLKENGHFYATTVGWEHMREIRELISKFKDELVSWGDVTRGFTLENGTQQLAAYFTDIKMHRYEDSLEVTELQPLIDYIASGWLQLEAGEIEAFGRFLEAEMAARGGVFHIRKDSGIFIAIHQHN